MNCESEEVECSECGAIFLLEDHEDHVCGQEEASTPKRRKMEEPSQSAQSGDDTYVGRLVESVQARPALWDHTLPLKERGKDIREKLWREVHEAINTAIPLQAVEKKWKNLRDTFLKHLKTYKPSGAGVDDSKKWKHFDALFFLANINSSRKTFGNFPSEERSAEVLAPTCSTSNAATSGADVRSVKKSGKKNLAKEADQLLLEVLKQPPPTPAAPVLNPALLAVQEVLNKLPCNIRMQAELEILNKVYALYAAHSQE